MNATAFLDLKVPFDISAVVAITIKKKYAANNGINSTQKYILAPHTIIRV